MGTTPLQNWPIPDPDAANDIPADLAALAEAAEAQSIMRFASTAARDATITSPVEGMVAVTGTGTSQVIWAYRAGAGWVPVGDVRHVVSATLSTGSGNITTTETVILTSDSGMVVGTHLRVTVSGKLNGSAAADLQRVRVRDGSIAGATLLTGVARVDAVGGPGQVDRTFIAEATVTPGPRPFVVTLDRPSGTGNVSAMAGLTLIIDEVA